jgi:hypothetical protein
VRDVFDRIELGRLEPRDTILQFEDEGDWPPRGAFHTQERAFETLLARFHLTIGRLGGGRGARRHPARLRWSSRRLQNGRKKNDEDRRHVISRVLRNPAAQKDEYGAERKRNQKQDEQHEPDETSHDRNPHARRSHSRGRPWDLTWFVARAPPFLRYVGQQIGE